MNTRKQTRLIDQLIIHDEISMDDLLVKIGEIKKDRTGVHTVKQRLQIEGWKSTLLTLGQGLEGLRLKHDALLECGT